MTSRVDAAILSVVSLLRADAGVTALATVYDGPAVVGDTPTTAVFVGYDGDPDGTMAATANWSRTPAGLGGLRRDEQFDVLCCVVSWSGDVDVPSRRAAVMAAFIAVDSALWNALRIGLDLPQPTTAHITQGQLYQEQGPSGLQARIPFGINVKTRI
jgi:hypothetical protein